MSVAKAVKMDKKKVDTQKAAAAPSVGLFGFVGEVKAEMKRITWTSPDELKAYTKIVVSATLICGFTVYFADVGIQGVLTGLAYVLRLITG